MEQGNKQTKNKNNGSKGNVFLAVILGLCVIVLAIADGCLFLTMYQSDQTQAYTDKQEAQQEESSTEDTEPVESEETAADSMNGFTAGDASVAVQPQESQPTATPAAQEATAAPTESATKSNGISNEDYILPDSNSKYYTTKDLKKLTREEVKLARNEIYARHGRKFVKDMSVKEYFEGKNWYQGTVDEVEDSELNKYEIANRDLIVKYEKKKKWN